MWEGHARSLTLSALGHPCPGCLDHTWKRSYGSLLLVELCLPDVWKFEPWAPVTVFLLEVTVFADVMG